MKTFTRFYFMFFGLALCCLPQMVQAQCLGGLAYNSYCYAGELVNEVAFEVCPSAGMIAQSTIIAGTFTIAPHNLRVFSGASGSGTSGTIVFGPASGDVSGNTFAGAAVDQCLIFVINSIPGASLTCADGFAAELEVCSESIGGATVSLTISPDEFCDTDGTQTLGGGLPTGGVYSGTGVTDDGNGTSFTFDPTGLGGQVVTVTYTNGGAAMDDITVFQSGSVSFTAPADLCVDAGVQTGLGGGTPTGGTYSGPGVTDDGNGMTYSFDPGIAGIGVHTISYLQDGGCMETAMDNIEVLAACGCPMGQTSYFYCQGNNESNVVAFEVCPSAGMAAQATITSGSFGVFLDDPDQLTVYQGASGSGTSGTVVFGPADGNLSSTVIPGNIADECLIFVVSTGPLGSCQDGLEDGLAVCGESIAPSVNFADPGDFCITDGTQTGLGGGTPTGGVYSGDVPGSVVDDGNGMTFSFDPAIAGVGPHILTYTLGGGSADVMVEVFPSGVVNFTAPNDLCIDAGIQTGLSGGMPSGGTYSGAGVTDNGNGTYDFNPAIAGLGVHTISYTEPVGCMETAMDDVEVLAACGCPMGEQTFFHCQDNFETDLVLFEICPTVPGMAVQATITQGSYGVVIPDDGLSAYSGLMGTGTGGDLVLDGAMGDLTGTIVESLSADGCLTFVSTTGPQGSCQDGLETPLQICAVDIPPPTSFTASPDMFCLNDGVQTGLSGGTPTGGMYSGPGVTDDGNGMTYTFDPATATVGMHTITYEAFGDPATDEVEVKALPNVGVFLFGFACENDPILRGIGGGSPTGGVYSGTGVIDNGDGVTYNFDPSVGPGVYQVTYTYTDPGTGCTNSVTSSGPGLTIYAAPTVTFTAPADICVNAAVQTGLGGGMPTGGVYSGPGVTDDGNGMTYTFDPVAATVGTHTITYTYTNSNNCTDSASDDIEVFGLPADGILPWEDFPFTMACEGEQVVFLAEAPAAGPPAIMSYSWTFSINNSSAFIEPGAGAAGMGQLATDGTPRRIGATWSGSGTETVDLTIETVDGCIVVAPTVTVTVNANPAEPVPAQTSNELCMSPDVTPSLANTGVSVGNTLGANELVIWVLTGAPAGSAYTIGDEFTSADCNGAFNDYGELAVANSSRVIRVQDPANAPAGTYTFDALVENCVTGCRSMAVGSFSITVYEAPSVAITADPDGDLCLGQMDVQYSANVTSSDGGTYTYLWCAYNSSDGSGTCFDGFDDNTAAMPSRDWTSSAGPKSVGVTVTSDVTGCSAEDLYSFEVVAPTMLSCPMDMMGTLITDDVTFDCAATFSWNHPEVIPGPCDPVVLTITISGGSVSEGPTAVTPGDPYTFTFEELGVFTVIYDLVDAVGNMSTCTFTITVDGLPCGWVDNGGIGCADNMNSSSFDPGTETFTVTANNCALTGWPYSSDQMAFVFTELCGDGEIIARVTSVSGTGFAGVMMRDSEDPSAPFMAMGTNRVNKVLKQVRILPGYPAFPQFVLSYDQFWVRIVRSGNQFMGFASTDGVSWTTYLNQQLFPSNNCLRVGMFTYSEKPGNPITATFDNVFVTGVATPLAGLPGVDIASQQGIESTPDVGLFPNPAASQISLEMGELAGQTAEIRIFNNVGQLMKQVSIDEVQYREQLNVADLNTGVYNVVIKAGDALITKRLLIARP